MNSSEPIQDVLVCPACRSGLKIKQDAVTCKNCKRVYPIHDGIRVSYTVAG